MNSLTNNGLRTKAAAAVFDSWKSTASAVLAKIDGLSFEDAPSQIIEMRLAIVRAKDANCSCSADESYLNDLYVLERCADFLEAYCNLWDKLFQKKFSDSWSLLQDALDLLRTIKRFSSIDVERFEMQLVQLEKLYPYNLFFSVGFVVERFECSICKSDIDFGECLHRRGQLYAGVMAVAIARNITTFDHVAVVLNPVDKRCVVTYDDAAPQFKLVRFLSELISDRRCTPLGFSHLEYSKLRVVNPKYVKVGRNQPCFCGSGNKFKRCCASKEYIETDHVEIIFKPRGE